MRLSPGDPASKTPQRSRPIKIREILRVDRGDGARSEIGILALCSPSPRVRHVLRCADIIVTVVSTIAIITIVTIISIIIIIKNGHLTGQVMSGADFQYFFTF